MPSLYNETLLENEATASPGYLVPCFNICLPEICNEVASSELDPTVAAALASSRLSLIDLNNGKLFYQHKSHKKDDSTTLVSQEFSNLYSNYLHSKHIELDPHVKEVKSSHVAWNPNSATLFGLSTEKGSVCLFDYRVPDTYSSWIAHIGKLSDLSFLKDNSLSHTIATAGYEDGWLYFWDMRKPGRCLKGLQVPHSISKIALSQDCSLLTISNRRADLQLFSLPLLSPFSHIGYRPSISAKNFTTHLEFSSNGRIILITGSEETTNKTRDATGIESYPICEVLDLQNPHQRSQVTNPASFWLNMENFNDEIELNPNSNFQNDDDSYLTHTTWKHFPRGVLINNSLLEDYKCCSKPYSLFTNRLYQTPEKSTGYDKCFYDSDDENSSSKPSTPGINRFHPSKTQKLETYNTNTSLKATDQHSIKKPLSEIYSTTSNILSDYRPYCCRFVGDLIVGVGGPTHMGGAMKLWDPMSGLMLSATVNQESRDPITSISPLGKSFVLSSGWDSSKKMGKVTLWSYTVQEQLQLLGMI